MALINGGKQSNKKLRVNARKVILATLVLCITFLIAVHVSFANKQSVLQDQRSDTTAQLSVRQAALSQDQKSDTTAQLSVRLKPSSEKKQAVQSISITASDDSKSNFHFIVSSDCTSYQRWETLTQLHSAQNAKQCGRFTWIVSGCLDEDSEQNGKGKGGANSDILTPTRLLEEVERHFPTFTVSNTNDKARAQNNNDCSVIHPHVHFTPDFSDMKQFGGPFADGKKKRVFVNRAGKKQTGSYGNIYKFNNKPNGLHHWIVDFLKKDERRDETIILIDPDFLFLTTFDFPGGFRVEPGKPAAARYGLGGQFLDFDLEEICHRVPPLPQRNHTCPFQSLTSRDVSKYYNAGPPYAIHVLDVLALSERWASLVPPTYDQYPLLYAEMFAYILAAADLNLKHTLFKELHTGCMTGDPHVNDDMSKDALAKSAAIYANLIETNPKGQEATSGGATSCFLPPLKPPPFLHYCACYPFESPYGHVENNPGTTDITTHFFRKRKVDHEILDCFSELAEVPFEPFISTKREKKSFKNPDWNVLALCAIVRSINLAKEKGCEAINASQSEEIKQFREKMLQEKLDRSLADNALAQGMLALAEEKKRDNDILESLEEMKDRTAAKARSLKLLLKQQQSGN